MESTENPGTDAQKPVIARAMGTAQKRDIMPGIFPTISP